MATTPAAHTGHYPAQQRHMSGPIGAIGGGQGIYKAPNPHEVFHLPDAANAAIPADIREQFQTDAQGRVLFFAAPPIPDTESGKTKLAHTPKYLAWKAKQMQDKLAKRKLEENTTAGAEDEKTDSNGVDPSKKQRTDTSQTNGSASAEAIFDKVTNYMCDLALEGWQSLYPEDGNGEWKKEMLGNLHQLGTAWEVQATEQEQRAAELKAQRAKESNGKILGLTALMDYTPPKEDLEWGRRR
jgi:chromatin structure-remodeling complex subunit RSC1/2